MTRTQCAVNLHGLNGCDVGRVLKAEQGRELIQAGTLLWLGVTEMGCWHASEAAPFHQPHITTVSQTFRDLSSVDSQLVSQ